MFDNVACGQFGSVHAPRLCYCFSVCGGRKKEPLLRSCFITCNSLQMAGMEARCKSSAKKKGGKKKHTSIITGVKTLNATLHSCVHCSS